MGEAAGTYRKLRLMDSAAMARVMSRMAREIVEALGGTHDFALNYVRAVAE